MPVRTVAFVDGFNLYHAIDELGGEHFKWLDLRAMVKHFALPPTYDLRRVLYFTAYATWKRDAWSRHRAYTAALSASGVESHVSRSKKKRRYCTSCKSKYAGHEEKETDVSIGAHLVDLAYRDEYDRALIVSGDSDLSPALTLVRAAFPTKTLKVLTPPGRRSTKGLVDASGAEASLVRRSHVERSLLPARVTGPSGSVVASRPAKWDPS